MVKPNQPRPQAAALRYDPGNENAPRLLAKGSGPVAERIIALAHEHGIPLHEDADLVRMLSLLDLDAEIPPDLYKALAEVLAQVYRLNAKR